MTFIAHRRKSLTYRFIATFVAFTFVFSSIPNTAAAQGVPTVLNLPIPGSMVPMSTGFQPAMVRGITINPNNPLEFDFIVDRGNTGLQGEELRDEATKLAKYFLASLTVPEDEMWVNLSPYEENRIIPESFGDTEMGRDLLAQDYMLKQLTASLMYPENELGNEFWNRVHTKAQKLYGTTDIPMNTFNKIWIVPAEATVYEHQGSAFVIKSKLKVMLEEDYLALQKNLGNDKFNIAETADEAEIISGATSEVVREVLIPEIEKEVNEGATFANLRQIYNAMILSTWYKINLKQSLLGQIYVDQNKTKGVDTQDKQINQKIYDQYIEAFKKGVYDYIREDYDPATQEIVPRKYFSGGFSRSGAANLTGIVRREIVTSETISRRDSALVAVVGRSSYDKFKFRVEEASLDGAQLAKVFEESSIVGSDNMMLADGEQDGDVDEQLLRKRAESALKKMGVPPTASPRDTIRPTAGNDIENPALFIENPRQMLIEGFLERGLREVDLNKLSAENSDEDILALMALWTKNLLKLMGGEFERLEVVTSVEDGEYFVKVNGNDIFNLERGDRGIDTLYFMYQEALVIESDGSDQKKGIIAIDNLNRSVRMFLSELSAPSERKEAIGQLLDRGFSSKSEEASTVTAEVPEENAKAESDMLKVLLAMSGSPFEAWQLATPAGLDQNGAKGALERLVASKSYVKSIQQSTRTPSGQEVEGTFYYVDVNEYLASQDGAMQSDEDFNQFWDRVIAAIISDGTEPVEGDTERYVTQRTDRILNMATPIAEEAERVRAVVDRQQYIFNDRHILIIEQSLLGLIPLNAAADQFVAAGSAASKSPDQRQSIESVATAKRVLTAIWMTTWIKERYKRNLSDTKIAEFVNLFERYLSASENQAVIDYLDREFALFGIEDSKREEILELAKAKVDDFAMTASARRALAVLDQIDEGTLRSLEVLPDRTSEEDMFVEQPLRMAPETLDDIAEDFKRTQPSVEALSTYLDNLRRSASLSTADRIKFLNTIKLIRAVAVASLAPALKQPTMALATPGQQFTIPPDVRAALDAFDMVAAVSLVQANAGQNRAEYIDIINELAFETSGGVNVFLNKRVRVSDVENYIQLIQGTIPEGNVNENVIQAVREMPYKVYSTDQLASLLRFVQKKLEQRVFIGNNERSREVKLDFDDHVWITAGKYSFRVWIDNDQAKIQLYRGINGRAGGNARTIEVNDFEYFKVGRSRNRGNNFIINDQGLSRTHFAIRVGEEDGQYFIQVIDQFSTGGTIVDADVPTDGAVADAALLGSATARLIKSSNLEDRRAGLSAALRSRKVNNVDRLIILENMLLAERDPELRTQLQKQITRFRNAGVTRKQEVKLSTLADVPFDDAAMTAKDVQEGIDQMWDAINLLSAMEKGSFLAIYAKNTMSSLDKALRIVGDNERFNRGNNLVERAFVRMNAVTKKFKGQLEGLISKGHESDHEGKSYDSFLSDLSLFERRVAVLKRDINQLIAQEKVVSRDAAMEATENVGGIDLNPALMNLQIKRDGNGVPLPMPQQNIESIKIDGLFPVIINVTPVTNMPFLLGLGDTQEDNTEFGSDYDMNARELDEIGYLN